MLIMTQDRISGLAAEKSPLKSFGPGNTQDDSNRNSWVSGDGTDSLTVNCLGQVNGLFLGRYRGDEVLLTYQGDELFSNKTSTGSIAVGYYNTQNSTGTISGTIESVTTDFEGSSYFYSNGSLVTIALGSDYNTDYINVDDLITVTGASTSTFNCPHRVLQVQKDNSFTRLNSSRNSVFSQTQGATGNKIQVVTSEIGTDAISVGETVNFYSGISIPLISAAIIDEDDVNFSYTIQFSIGNNSLLGNNVSPFTLNEYVSFEDVTIASGSTTTHTFGGTTYSSYYISSISEDGLTFSIFVKPTSFLSTNLVNLSFGSSPKVNTGTTLIYDGGGYQHKLGLDLISGSSSSAGSEEFTNNEVIRLSSPTVSGFDSNEINQFIFNGITQTKLVNTIVKDRARFSISLPFLVKDGGTQKSFLFGSSDSITMRKYVLDNQDAATTETGVGSPIRRINVATRTQNTVADFVQGKIIRVESNYIPLPREAFPTQITVEMNSTINHNAANLFNQFLLEELVARKPTAASTTGTITSTSEFTTYKTDVTTFNYNSNNNGELFLNVGSTLTAATSDGIKVGDHIYLIWPNNAAPYTNASPILKTSALGTTGTTFVASSNINEIYEGMEVQNAGDSLSGVYVLSTDTVTNTITTNIAHGVTHSGSGTALKFLHSSTLAAEASAAWTGIHRVKSVGSTQISIVVPNAGTSGDLTIPSSIPTTFKSVSGAYFLKVEDGKGRFVRPIAEGIVKADAILWNSGSSDVTYTYSGTAYKVLPATAQLIFSGAHSLVNNDKLIVYNLDSATNGSSLRNFKSSYLVSYNTSNVVSIDIETHSEISITSIEAENSSTTTSLLVTTSTDHALGVGDSVTLNNIPAAHNGEHVVVTAPSSNQFTVTSSFSSGYKWPTGSGTSNGKLNKGVHFLTSFSNESGNVSSANTTLTNSTGSIILNAPCARSVSIANARSSFENPIEVGNLIYRDAYQNSSGQYDSVTGTAVFKKTPNIDDATSTTPYRTDSATALQNTFVGTADSVVSQISLIRGDATTQNDIHLIKPFGLLNEPFVFTRLLLGLKMAILRAGISRSLPNPQVGVQSNNKDYSVRKELPTGAYYYLNRDSAKEFQGRLISAPDNVDQLIDFGTEQLARPFPCLVISGNSGNIKKLRTRTALYGYFINLPQSIFNNKLNNLKEANFAIREVL